MKQRYSAFAWSWCSGIMTANLIQVSWTNPVFYLLLFVALVSALVAAVILIRLHPEGSSSLRR